MVIMNPKLKIIIPYKKEENVIKQLNLLVKHMNEILS